MTDTQLPIGYTDGEVDCNRSDNPTLQSMVEQRYSRRNMLRSGFGATAAAVFGSMPLVACSGDKDNAIPAVSAGSSGSTNSGQVISLVGTATDADGTIASVAWTQTSGTAVALNNANTTTATFLAPSVTTGTPLKFLFTATDNKGGTTTAETTVTVNPAQLTFSAVAKNTNDLVSVPAGYSVTVLYRLGDPIAAGTAAYANNGTDTDFSKRAGDHHDGIRYFGLSATGTRDEVSNTRAVMCMNHENISQRYLHANGATAGANRVESEALKEMECHGVSAIEIVSANNVWSYVQNSTFNRRVTPLTPMTFSGPVAGTDFLKTKHSPTGVAGRGTVNNCANGYTPWGTYITCEENWAGYFRRASTDIAPNRTAAEVATLARYGVAAGAAGSFGWATVVPADPANTAYARWNVTADPALAADGTGDFRNEANQFGWVVEIDPYDATSTPRKRTALGRMGHEGCWPSLLVAGRKPAFYMGDDSKNEYLYKFVSNTPWVAADANSTNRLAMGDKYMDAGTLYVARFDATGAGVWLPLVFGTGALVAPAFTSQADVLINTHLAADAVFATKMDRPEWTAINPKTGEVYLTLTNNDTRTLALTDAANPRHYNDPKGAGATAQRGNPNGHIIRMREAGDNSEALTFTWDIYAFGAGSDLEAANINLSGLDASNDFSSPDGLYFSRPTNAGGQVNPVLWIQTDDGAYTDVSNCMMLAAMPGIVGDGAAKNITNTDSGGATRAQATFVGKAPGMTLRRFLVGPKECEITGIDTTPDGRALFVNIQHPGESTTTGFPATFPSNWPASQTNPTAVSRPRSSTIVITRADGGVVGLS